MDRTRLYALAGIIASVAVLGMFYTPHTSSAPATVFGFGFGEILFPNGWSLTHGWAAVSFLVVVAIAAYFGAFAKHKLVLGILVAGAGIFALSDYAEFLGPYLPWVWAGSALSIVMGGWFGFLTAEAVKG